MVILIYVGRLVVLYYKVLLISDIFCLNVFTQRQLSSPDTECTHVHIGICMNVTFYMFEQLCKM